MPAATELDPRGRRLRAALGFLRLPPTEPELQLLHRWLDTWTAVGLITVGVERQGVRLSLWHVTEGEWRAMFLGDPLISARGFGVAATPWGAVQRAAWATLAR
jgi:hypothetical protein